MYAGSLPSVLVSRTLLSCSTERVLFLFLSRRPIGDYVTSLSGYSLFKVGKTLCPSSTDPTQLIVRIPVAPMPISPSP